MRAFGDLARPGARPFEDCKVGVDTVAGVEPARGVKVSESIPGKSDTELAIEAFVDSIEELHPNLDREEFRDAISTCVHDALNSADGGEETDGEDESGDEEE